MKEKPSEWIVIADLMSGVVAVVMLMLVVSLVQKQEADQRHKAEMTRGADAQQKQIASMLGEMESAFKQDGAARFVAIDKAAGKITLLEHAFPSGSACIEPQAKAAFAKFKDKIATYLQQVQDGQIYVEGHTDNQQVYGAVTELHKNCTVYDDNFTLSAARAREARLLLVRQGDAEAAKRLVVAGFGDSHPLPGLAPSDARNRRVELRFVTGAAH
jgi:chemotaxis protein MotB